MSELIQSVPVVSRMNADTLRKRPLMPVLVFAVFSLFVSLWFFREAINADATSLVGDQINILAICAKKDFPNLLNSDQVVGDTRNIEFYTPFFIDVVRLLSRPDANYLRGLNIMLLITSLLYFWGWWLLFSLWGNRWLAGVLAFIVRGIMYPPGLELWGIAGLWTMLPRTLFLALVPFVLWSWLKWRDNRRAWVVILFSAGLLTNIHPISGLCVALAILAADATWTYLDTKELKALSIKLVAGGIAALIGMFPFIWTYLSKVRSVSGVSEAAFEEALHMRIGPLFWDPLLYGKLWLRPKWLTLALLPWLVCLLIPRHWWAAYRKTIAALGVFALTCVLTAVLPFAIESLLKKAGYDARFAFQLVRAGKYVMIPTILLTGLLLTLAARLLAERFRGGSKIVGATLCMSVVLTLFAQHPVFKNVPILGDDIVRFLWPVNLGQIDEQEHDLTRARTDPINGVLRWIRNNTPPEAKFVGPRAISSFALRSVIHDWKGAVVLIEGNPAGFVKAANMEKTLRQPRYADPKHRAELFVTWGADYWVTRWQVPDLPIAYSEPSWFVYDLRTKPDREQFQVVD